MSTVGEPHQVTEIASHPAEVETLATYEDRIEHYVGEEYSFVPIPSDGQYYDLSEGMLKPLSRSQFISDQASIRDALARLCDVPFLLVSPYHDGVLVVGDQGPIGIYRRDKHERWDLPPEQPDMAAKSPNEFGEVTEIAVHEVETSNYEYPKSMEWPDYDRRYGIITLADVNKRRTRYSLYPLFSELAGQLAERIESKYPDSSEIFDSLRAVTVGRWYKERMRGIHLHVTEHMNLVEMKEVIKASDQNFVEECGFPSKNQVDKRLSSLNQLRNKVMHANRTMIHDRTDLEKMVERIRLGEQVVDGLREC